MILLRIGSPTELALSPGNADVNTVVVPSRSRMVSAHSVTFRRRMVTRPESSGPAAIVPGAAAGPAGVGVPTPEEPPDEATPPLLPEAAPFMPRPFGALPVELPPLPVPLGRLTAA